VILRPYQQAAIDAVIAALRLGNKRPIACLPTGSGKSPVICTMVADLAKRYPDQRFLITTHTQELIAQLAETYEHISGTIPGVYAASLNRRDTNAQVLIGQVQSIYRKIPELGAFKLISIDEAHSVPPEGAGQYRTMLRYAELVNPDVSVCGWTATPYRLGKGLCFGPGMPFQELVFDAPIKDLIKDGYLSPLVAKDGGKPNLSGVGVQNGEYVQSQLEAVMTDEKLVSAAVTEIIRYGRDRKAWLLFASGIKHAHMISEALRARDIEAPIITGDTSDSERKRLIARYKDQNLGCLVNVGVLTTGFDATHIDLVGLLRPTKSPGLYYQMVGRGLRIHPGKENTMILDLAGNIAEHGPIDTLNDRIKRAKSAKGKGHAPTKTCEKCQEIVPAGIRKCPACGNLFPELRIAKHAATADNSSPLSTSKPITHTVSTVQYYAHAGKDPTKPSTLRVVYRCGLHTFMEFISIDVVSHPYARSKALVWVRDNPTNIGLDGRTLRCDKGVIIGTLNCADIEIRSVVDMLPFTSCLIPPTQIEVQQNGKYQNVVRRHWKTKETI